YCCKLLENGTSGSFQKNHYKYGKCKVISMDIFFYMLEPTSHINGKYFIPHNDSNISCPYTHNSLA
ncbi:hypothetical protein L9F63_021294, partial [Diploptera punctata]